MSRPRPRVLAADRRRQELLDQAEARRVANANALTASEDLLSAAAVFCRKYDGVGVERAEAQSFWNDLLAVFGVDRRAAGVEFERVTRRSDTGGTGRIDVLWPGVLLAEHKSAGKDLQAALAQADAYELSAEEMPRLTVVCDFARFLIRDNHTGRSVEFDLAALPKRLGWFSPLLHNELDALDAARPVDVAAAERMADLHDQLRAAGYGGHPLRVLMTRLVFCFFADDTRIWEHGKLDKYLRSAGPEMAGPALEKLFATLNTAPGERSALLSERLATFPYVNGGLFAEQLPISDFSPELFDVLLAASEEVDWSAVSPAVFGAMFQGVMNADERHSLGAHYTSEANILKVIEPLFLDDLYSDIAAASTVAALERVWVRMASWRFLDPAAGCGNFLVVAYRELRRAERHLMAKIRSLGASDARVRKRFPWVAGQRFLDAGAATRLGVGQFHGIEIDEWPAQIATVAMWLTDHLENMALEEQFGGQQTRLPLTDSVHVLVGNSLQVGWEEVLPAGEASFVFGNPPFLGRAMRDPNQVQDMKNVWGRTRGAGNIDYVTCWFRKAADYIDGTDVRVGFVATNSISQGEQPAVLWGYLYDRDCHIDFAHRSFAWTNEAKGKAAVHVVIVGFSQGVRPGRKPLWHYPDPRRDGERAEVSSINAYLVDGPEILVGNRRTPVSPGVPLMRFGSMPHDGGHLLLTPGEAAQMRATDPVAATYLRQVIGSAEMIQGKSRWCLWLPGARPADLRSSPVLRERAERVRQVRLASPDPSAVQAARTPLLFKCDRQPPSRYLAVSRVSSERRDYVPMAFFDPDVIATNALLTLAGADTYTFGVLSSRVFNAWARTVSGRLESRLRLSAEVTYNNFPWPAPTDKQRDTITNAAQEVLDVRDQHPGATLADLYDPLIMPANLVAAHRRLDRAVLAAYNLPARSSDDTILTELFNRYRQLSDEPAA